MFRFKLEFLLDHRRRLEEKEMMELARRLREAGEIEAEIDRLNRRSREIDQEIIGGKRAVHAAVFTMYTEYAGHLREAGRDAAYRLSRAEKTAEKQRRKLVQASVDRKVIEKYKERRREEYERQEALRESKVMDELAALVRARKSSDE